MRLSRTPFGKLRACFNCDPQRARVFVQGACLTRGLSGHDETTMPTDRLLPNKRIRRVLLAIQEVMGRNGLNAMLQLARLDRFINALPPDDAVADVRASEYAALIQAVETQFGSSARGQLNRIGQRTFRQIVSAESLTWRWIAISNGLLPPRRKLRRALKQLAKNMAEPDGHVAVYSDDQRLVLVDETSDGTAGRARKTESCWLTLGQIQECACWALGAPYDVAEVSCKAKGDQACKFEIGEALG